MWLAIGLPILLSLPFLARLEGAEEEREAVPCGQEELALAA
jgi:hypothetical protein